MTDRSTSSSTIHLGTRSLLFIGGKGGVGKTTTAAALAVWMAQRGERVLLVSTDPAHSLGDLFDRTIGDREVELVREGEGSEPGVVVGLEVDPEAEVERYLEEVKANMRTFMRPSMFSEIERQIELTRHAPGATEAAMMDRLADLMHHAPERFDRVLFDTAPTGHTLRLLTLPEIMSAWTDGLLRSRDRSDAAGLGLSRLLGRKERRERTGSSEAGAESPPEAEAESPSAEAPTGDDLAWFDQPTDSDEDPRSRKIREVLLNRRRRFTRARRSLLDPETTAFVLVLIPERLPILESRTALRVLEEHHVPVAGLVVNRVLPTGTDGGFIEERRIQEAEYLERIDREFSHLPRVRVPLLARDVEGVASLREIARRLMPSLE